MMYCIPRGTVWSPWLHYGINEFITYQHMIYILNFLVEICPVLTYEL
jgi:hypothetical protein